MSLSKVLKINRILMMINGCALFLIGTGIIFYWNQNQGNKVIEANRIILRGSDGNPSIILQGNQENTLITLNDDKGNVRLQLQGGHFPAVIMKNEENEIVGTLFPLKDGGAAIGLGDRKGNMAAFLKGGASPTMSFYHQSSQPNLAMGISHHLPHFALFPIAGKEGMLIHGKKPTSLLFIDEKGEIPLSISRYGLYQNKQDKKENLPKEESKIFSYWKDFKASFDSISMFVPYR